MKHLSFEVRFQQWSQGRNEEGAKDRTGDVGENQMTGIIFWVEMEIETEKENTGPRGLNFPRRSKNETLNKEISTRLLKIGCQKEP